MNASTLVDLLLELNIVNVKDVDNEIAKLAARVTDPRAQKWFRRVPRFFLINIDRLLKEPYVAKAEPRGIRGGKYYADPTGGWRKGQQPAEPETSPMPVKEAEGYDPKEQTYTTALHEPAVQRDIEQSFTPFKPDKAKATRHYGEPPTKKELQPWMTDPAAKEKEFHHFDPIQTRRRELFLRLSNLATYLNYMGGLLQRAKAGEELDDSEQANADYADRLMRKLEVMKTDDIHGFRDVLKEASDFMGRVKDKPWLFTKDGKKVASQGDLIMRKVVFPETASAFSKRLVAAGERTSVPTEGGFWPVWCTKSVSYAKTYCDQGPLYFIDKNDIPYVLAHFPTHQVYNIHDRPITDQQINEIAPLFTDAARFSIADLNSGDQRLGAAVQRLRSRLQRGGQ